MQDNPGEARAEHLELAVQLALENVAGDRGGPFAAVVTRDHEVIACATNAVVRTNDPTAHAEIRAIRAACSLLGTFQLADCLLYCSCEPCPMCLGALYWARPRAVFHAAWRTDAAAVGFDDAAIWEQFALPPGARQLPVRQLATAAALAPFEAWAASPTRIDY